MLLGEKDAVIREADYERRWRRSLPSPAQQQPPSCLAPRRVQETLTAHKREVPDLALATFTRPRHGVANGYVQTAYLIYIAAWALTVWGVMIHAEYVQKLLGSDVEETVLRQWTLTVLVDLCGVQVVKLVVVVVCREVRLLWERAFATSDEALLRWYEEYIFDQLKTKYITSVPEDNDPTSRNPRETRFQQLQRALGPQMHTEQAQSYG
ncbi:hypothetical protein CYMTET_15620 [Cymbomonas tetramitiformis]|uniref:Anoctamin n=1 Tax=Cymbomonas tetramitiformis TaxID=36881 RepID=A0AAE0GF49_9CHLO|nr:hypothetical protein CYMTET_15620 [Cymbomonas tetramitiformis]